MIGRLTGKVVAQEPEGAIVVDVGGVGYEIFAPMGTAGRAAVDDHGRATFFVHTHAREEALTLFGFATDADRGAFRTLIGVSGVGPKTALAVLGALPADDLAMVIAAKDLGKLTSVPGIGKKTAERLVLELRDRLGRSSSAVAPPSGSPTAHAAPGPPRELLVGALTRMGYRPAEADRAAAALAPRLSVDPLPDLVREALALLAK
jgi:Holliday junction DNA helicase RuvA